MVIRLKVDKKIFLMNIVFIFIIFSILIFFGDQIISYFDARFLKVSNDGALLESNRCDNKSKFIYIYYGNRF